MAKGEYYDNAMSRIVAAKLAAAEKANELRAARHKWLLTHLEGLLEIVEHYLTSCSDEDPRNWIADSPTAPRCLRCQLLYLKKQDYNDEWVMDFTIRRDPCGEIDADIIRRKIEAV